MTKWMSFLLITFLALNAEAALPPLYQTATEINSIMTDEQLGEKLPSGEPIVEIKKNDEGYQILTNKHRLQVHVMYKKAAMPGPAQFDLKFDEAVSLSNKSSYKVLTHELH